MKQQKKRTKTTLNWMGISWLALVILSIVFFFIAIEFIAFPQKYILVLGLVLASIDIIMGYFSLKKKRKQFNRKPIKKMIISVINCILCVTLMTGSVYLPILQSQMVGIFVNATTETQSVRINAYVMTSEYKTAHADVFVDKNTSTNLSDYKEKKFITQVKVDQDNQSSAMEDIQKQLDVNRLNTFSAKDIIGEATALYNGLGDVMIMNENYVDSFLDVPGYENFASDTQILYTSVITVNVENKQKVSQDYTNSSFSLFIAGSDSHTSTVNYYTRTDVDMILTVDPVNKQILLFSIPRDWYVKNPALGNGYDKLTHLGNDGIQNTVDGLNQEFGFEYIKNYFEVNFATFYNIVEAIDGIDVDNPYAFSSQVCESIGNIQCSGNYDFEQGTIHLSGDQALAYARERYSLPNGDYGRNEHQAIVLQAIIRKLTSKEIISNYNDLLNNLQGNFLTSLSADDIYSLAKMQLNDGGNWSFISYHLGGVGDNNVTASMGDQLLYVSYPIADQVEFAKEQIEMVMNGETVTQGELPSDDQTVFLPN